MTDQEKRELLSIVKEALGPAPDRCPNGITPDETAYLRELASAFKHGKRAMIAAFGVAIVGALVSAIGIGIRVMLKAWPVTVGAALLLGGGCAAYQSQTTVFGVEVAYNPTQSVVPTARAGIITHRQNTVNSDRLYRMRNAIGYYELSVWSGEGTLTGEMEMSPAE